MKTKHTPKIGSFYLFKREKDPEFITHRMGNRAKHLGRVAAEYTQLLYHTSKARADKCVFMDKVQPVGCFSPQANLFIHSLPTAH